MRHKLAAARQLGIAGLFRRMLWRARMIGRVSMFYLARRREAGVPGNTDRGLVPKYSLLPPAELIAELAAQGAIDQRERERIAVTASALYSDEVELRGIGRFHLKQTPCNWYEYADMSSEMINRHDFILPLVQSAILDHSVRAREKLDELFLYWIRNFDVARLLSFDKPIDAAIRMINWLWVFSFDLLSLDEKVRTRLVEIIRLQMEYISAWRSAGGNHLVLEALAHYMVSVAFPAMPGAQRWRRWSRKTLINEISRQTTLDGVHTEQSMFYHQAVATHFLKFVLTAEAAGDTLPAKALERYGSMLDYVHTTMKPDSTHPVLGDGDPMVTDDREHWEAKALLAARSRIFERPVYEAFASSINDAAVWLLGMDSRDVAITDVRPGSVVLADTGLAVLRDGTRYVFFDAAAFADPEFPHHGHADALSVLYFSGGTDVLVDPGGYGYYNDEFRRFFRSTAAHNTVALDDNDQSELFGVLGYGRLASANLDGYMLSDRLDYVAGSHDGYRPNRHYREVFFRKGELEYLLIIDHLKAAGAHDAAVFFHFPPGMSLDGNGGRLSCATREKQFRAAVVSRPDSRQTVIRGRRKPAVQGWVSERTGSVEPADTWEVSLSFSDSAWVATLIASAEHMPELVLGQAELRVAGDRTDVYRIASRERSTRYCLNVEGGHDLSSAKQIEYRSVDSRSEE